VFSLEAKFIPVCLYIFSVVQTEALAQIALSVLIETFSHIPLRLLEAAKCSLEQARYFFGGGVEGQTLEMLRCPRGGGDEAR